MLKEANMENPISSLPVEESTKAETEVHPTLTLDDLLSSNSEALERIAHNIEHGRRYTTASHNSGHHSGQGHNSGPAMVERPLNE
jgi:hypothetical protein